VIDHPDVNNPEHYAVGRNEAEAREKAAKKFNVAPEKIILEQDEDVLDTWFSSGLFPFSAMGWPDENAPDMKAFFPGDLLETGGDILFFWVARMVMMSLELTDKLPFKTVFLHPMVRDEEGAKMSKSKGNVIDPLEVMDGCELDVLLQKLTDSNLPESEVAKFTAKKKQQFPDGLPECGTDSLRFAMLAYMSQSSINLDVKRVIGYREFCNKLWNINRFALSNFDKVEGFVPFANGKTFADLKLSHSDKWILTRLSKLIVQVNKNFEEYRFGDMTDGLYAFWRKELADFYLEAIKPVMNSEDAAAKEAALTTLYVCLDCALKMLHPTMPYLTEELYQRLPHAPGTAAESICIAEFPKDMVSFEKENIEADLALIRQTVGAIRS
jgi:valyl-tRNA synthetase